jgi:hypothetical protein
VGRTIPLINSIKWLNLMQDNMVACAKNYKKFNIKTLLFSFVFPNQERFQRLANLLKQEGCSVYHITLICEPSDLEKRIKIRNTQKLISIQRAIQLNNEIKKLQSHYSINTTQKSPEEVADIICDEIIKLESRSEIINE